MTTLLLEVLLPRLSLRIAAAYTAFPHKPSRYPSEQLQISERCQSHSLLATRSPYLNDQHLHSSLYHQSSGPRSGSMSSETLLPVPSTSGSTTAIIGTSITRKESRRISQACCGYAGPCILKQVPFCTTHGGPSSSSPIPQ